MSQPVGLSFKSRIPTFSDDASIEEALRVYHYGIDNYSNQPIPNDSIEGNFRTLDIRVTANEDNIAALGQTFIEEISSSSDPNEIVPENLSVVPLSIKGAVNQSVPLQNWKNSSSTNIVSVFPNGGASFANYVSIGNIAQTTTSALKIQIINSAHSGIVVRPASGQTSNIQEWQNSSGSVISRIAANGKVYSNNSEVVNLVDTQTMSNKTLTSPTINGGTVVGSTSITLSGSQDNSSRARNITFSTLDPVSEDGEDGDLWIKYLV